MKFSLNKKALRRAFWGALGRLIGMIMASGAGTLLYQVFGSNTSIAISLAVGLVIVGFIFTLIAEYEREID